MSLPSQTWDTIHPSSYRFAAEPVRRVQASRRPSGAIRYCCPVTDSFVLITDAPTLARLAERDVRLRCADCGEIHLLARDAPAAIVGNPAKP
jgi:hypothetical protein